MEEKKMKNEDIKNKKILILGIIIFVILSILTIQNLIVFSTEQLKGEEGKRIDTSKAEIVERKPPKIVDYVDIETYGNCPGPHIGREIVADDLQMMPDHAGNPFWATAGGVEGFYCMQNGVSFYQKGANGSAPVNYSELLKRVKVTGTKSEVQKAINESKNLKSLPHIFCDGSHDTNLSEISPKVAFMVASGEYSQQAVQNAVWKEHLSVDLKTESGETINISNDVPTDEQVRLDGEKELAELAQKYEEFQKEIDEWTLPDLSGGLNITVNTDDAQVQVDYDRQVLKIGPIYINYPEGGPFGGLSDLYFEGKNALGETVKGLEHMAINKFGMSPDDINITPKFYNPDTEVIPGTNGNKTLLDMSDDQSYPSSGQGFYVEINNPNAGISESFSSSTSIPVGTIKESIVTKLQVHVPYRWFGKEEVIGCFCQSHVATLEYTQNTPIKTSTVICSHGEHDSDCYKDIDEDGEEEKVCGHSHKDSCYLYKAEAKNGEPTCKNAQAHLVVTRKRKEVWEQDNILELDIKIDIDLSLNVNFNINVNIEGAGDYTMMLGGKVWEDTFQGKEGKANGIKDENDKVLPNVKVTLYEVQKGKETEKPGKIARPILSEVGTTSANVMHTINPTYTDENGEYLFIGIDPLKKYYVEFEYNGQTYIPTEYEMDVPKYNSEEWRVTSKGTETPRERDSYNLTLSEIGSSPANYKSSNSLGWLNTQDGGYNQSFSQYDLMGFELDADGNYRQGTRLIDSYYKIDGNGNIIETDEFQEGEISKAIKKYIKDNLKTPDEDAMKTIYASIAGNNQEIKKMMQFIEDTKIHSYTQAQGAPNYDLYPVYNQFTLNNKGGALPAGFWPGIYQGQLFINQGLVRREETDLSLRKDALYAATRINGETEVYEYNKRDSYTAEQTKELQRLRKVYEENGRKPEDYQAYLQYKAEIENNNNYWQLQLRMRDYTNYYGTTYTKELYQADYNYRSDLTNGAGKDKELELYVTYKVTIRNASQSILDEVTEIVDFYDKDYTYRDDLSWVMYKKDSNSTDVEEIAFTESDYHDTIHNLSLQGNIQKNNKGTNASSNSQYESRTPAVRSDMTENYNDVYIGGLAGKKLASGEEAYVYLTFQVNSDDKGPVILDEDNSLKYNYAEINGYKTYYKDGTNLPNGVTKNSQDVAGIIDINSTPGNLCKNDLQGEKYEKNFENDTDRAKAIKVTVDEQFIRSVNGNVWEEQRNKEVSGSWIGDGVYAGEIGIQGITVELVEKLERGGEYVWQRTTTDANGKYEFKTDKDLGIFIIPGNYVVRFRYGDTYQTAQTVGHGEGKNTVSYNGQDFKSTVYQKDMNGEELAGYNDQYYDIRASDAFGKNISDAKDVYNTKTETVIDRLKGNTQESQTTLGREGVIKYSNNKVTNHKAEVMASPYEAPDNTNLIDELIENTNMVADTAIIVLKGEYNRDATDGNKAESNNVDETDFLFGNDKNGNYTLNNIDLGLVERPKAALELGKKITRIKVTLANESVPFDTDKSMNDLSWAAGSAYELDKVGLRDQNNKYQEFYGANHRYAYRTRRGTADYSVNELVASKYDSSKNNGLIQIIMDEELMHGATIRISYELTVTNVGEKDFEGQDFYYKGTNASKVVTTSADVVLDYVANNLQFRETDNTSQNGWQAVDSGSGASNVEEKTDYVLSATGINERLRESVSKYNTVIQTSNLSKALTPKEKGNTAENYSTKAGLVLTQLITPQNSQDDKTYDNIAEISTITNTVGRRMAYSVQGNQDPLANPAEVDSIKSEQVIILPPFGSGNWIVYVTLAAVVLAILTTGIILIKKKVLKN